MDEPKEIFDGINKAVAVLNKQGMSSLQVSECTGKRHADVMRDIRNLLEQGVSERNFALSSYAQEQPNGGVKSVPMYTLTPKGVLILASGYNAVLREKIINRLEELEKGVGSTDTVPTQPKATLSEEMKVAQWAMKQLRLSDVARLHMVKQITDKVGLTLPGQMANGYVPSKGDKFSATELLKRNGFNLSALAFNKIAAAKGVLVQLTRPGKAGKVHKWWSITKQYLTYGENDVNEKNPLETTAHWYSDTFTELCGKLNIKREEALA